MRIRRDSAGTQCMPGGQEQEEEREGVEEKEVSVEPEAGLQALSTCVTDSSISSTVPSGDRSVKLSLSTARTRVGVNCRLLRGLLVGIRRPLNRHPKRVEVFAHASHQLVSLQVLLPRRESADVGHVRNSLGQRVHPIRASDLASAQRLFRQCLQEGRQLEGGASLVQHVRPQEEKM
nr:hypothetical protein BaRGS_003283 [Batillaria attramentaria]